MITEIENTDVFDTQTSKDFCLVDIYAPWCGPCKMLSPNIEKVAKDLNIKVLKVNSDNNMEIAMRYRVMSVPTILLFKDGKVVDSNIGYMEIDELNDWIKANL